MTEYAEQRNPGFMPSIGSSNDYGVLTALGARLDTRPLLDDIELWLRGSLIRQEIDKEGNVTKSEFKFAESKANNEGIQSILMIVSSVLNSQFVQGNWDDAKYEDFMYDLHETLAMSIFENLYVWGINEQNYRTIIMSIVLVSRAFASRLLGDGERKSYGLTMRMSESNGEQKKGGLNFFGGGK
ncbi:MAG: hypothetical protein ACTSYG_07580 [Candidatus Heimdallarchaeota archaeon]